MTPCERRSLVRMAELALPITPWRAVAVLGRKVSQHHTLLVSSGVAFSCVLGVIPAIVVVVAIYGLVASPAEVESHIGPIVDVLPRDAGRLLVEQLQNVTAVSDTDVTIGLILGLLGSLWAISSAMNALVMAIRIAHEMPSPHNWLQGRLFALRLSSIAVFATASILWFIVVLPPVLSESNPGRAVDWALRISRWPLAFLVTSISLALLYRVVLGHRPYGHRSISLGAVTATTLWVLSTYALKVAYDFVGTIESTFGSLSAVAALMVWIYLSALSALLGAEVDGAFHRHTTNKTNGNGAGEPNWV